MHLFCGAYLESDSGEFPGSPTLSGWIHLLSTPSFTCSVSLPPGSFGHDWRVLRPVQSRALAESRANGVQAKDYPCGPRPDDPGAQQNEARVWGLLPRAAKRSASAPHKWTEVESQSLHKVFLSRDDATKSLSLRLRSSCGAAARQRLSTPTLQHMH